MTLLLILAAINWLTPIVVGYAMALAFFATGDTVYFQGLQTVVDARGPLARALGAGNWSGFTVGTASLLWRGCFDEAVGHERGHVWLWLAFGLVGHLLGFLAPIPVMRTFATSWREAYHKVPVELFCRWYGPRWAAARSRR